MIACNGQTCGTCRWWVRQGPPLSNAILDPRVHVDEGTCQAHAPFVVEQSMMAISVFPQTHETRFCGDWCPTDTGGGGGGDRVVRFPAPTHRIAA
jgi:hypothetical protein